MRKIKKRSRKKETRIISTTRVCASTGMQISLERAAPNARDAGRVKGLLFTPLNNPDRVSKRIPLNASAMWTMALVIASQRNPSRSEIIKEHLSPMPVYEYPDAVDTETGLLDLRSIGVSRDPRDPVVPGALTDPNPVFWSALYEDRYECVVAHEFSAKGHIVLALDEVETLLMVVLAEGEAIYGHTPLSALEFAITGRTSLPQGEGEEE